MAVLDLYYHLWYSRAKSGAADSDCGVKLGAENSLSGFNHCVSSPKTTVLQYRYRYSRKYSLLYW